jgi:hypothetical protein
VKEYVKHTYTPFKFASFVYLYFGCRIAYCTLSSSLFLNTHLKTAADIKGVVELNNICTKMCLLTIAFPQLRIVWSRDARATVDIFQSLKIGQPEPGLEMALTYGGESVEPANQSAEEILQRLPGITVCVC